MQSLAPSTGQVLGEGLAEKFASLDEEKQSWILDALQKDNDFSRAFAKIFPKNLEVHVTRNAGKYKGLGGKVSTPCNCP